MLSLGGFPLSDDDCSTHCTRDQYVRYMHRVVAEAGLRVRTHHPLSSLRPVSNGGTHSVYACAFAHNEPLPGPSAGARGDREHEEAAGHAGNEPMGGAVAGVVMARCSSQDHKGFLGWACATSCLGDPTDFDSCAKVRAVLRPEMQRVCFCTAKQLSSARSEKQAPHRHSGGEHGRQQLVWQAQQVVLAVGRLAIPTRLSVDGSGLPHVHDKLRGAEGGYEGREVLVVGGGQ